MATDMLHEVDVVQRQWTQAVMLKVKENAKKLETLYMSKLSERVALQQAEIDILQEEIKRLLLNESPPNLKEMEQHELNERLEAQIATNVELESQIQELREQLRSKRLQSKVDAYVGKIDETNEDIGSNEEHDIRELTEDEVLQLEPRALIDHIRRDLGVDGGYVSPKHSKILKAMRTKLGSALEKLAHDIYSNESQIILEIIQNADDNSYNPGTEPFLSVLVKSDRHLWITNNEVGFSNANVIAISNVGGSTKKDASRFTGHKGIGFKSVFKVTRTPYIISKDFCFRFNLDSELAEDNIGYILPEWVNKEELESLIAPQTIDPNMTHFYFPFSKTSCFPAEELYDGFDMIPLFLRQLHRLELCLNDKKKVVVVSHELMKDHVSSMLETLLLSVEEYGITTEGISEVSSRQTKYRLYRKMLDVPGDLRDTQSSRRPQTRTELILVFPFIEDRSIGVHELEIQKVYSYLPVERAGFRFAIQGDFHLVSSRDKVHTQDLYNRWLSWMIPNAFKEAFGLGEDGGMPANHLRDDLFFFLPLKEELTRSGNSESGTDGFWRRVMHGIRDAVLEAPCVLTETGKWAKPQQVRLRPKLFKDLFTNDELHSALLLDWVSEKVTEKAVYGLGCQYLNAQEALWIINHEGFNIHGKSSDWFHKVYTFLGLEIKTTQDLISDIFSAKMFPLVAGNISSLKEGELFITNVIGHYDLGPNVLRLLDSKIVNLNGPADPARRFLDMIGIKEITAVDIANSILKFQYRLKRPLPSCAQTTTEVTPAQLWEQLRFVKDHWQNIGTLFPYLEAGLFVPVVVPVDNKLEIINVGNEFKSSSDKKPCSYFYSGMTYLPQVETFVDKIDPELKKGMMFLDTVISNEGSKDDVTSDEWINFLTVKLGVNKSLRLIKSFKTSALSWELTFALKRAVEDANSDLSQKWTDLLVHLQSNWKTLRMAKMLITQIKTSKSGFGHLRISELLPDLSDYKILATSSDGSQYIRFPSITGLTDKEMLSDLGIPATLCVDGLIRMMNIFQNPKTLAEGPIKDVDVWKKMYVIAQRLNTLPKFIFIPNSEGGGDFVDTALIRLQIPDVFKSFTCLVEFPATIYDNVPQMKMWFGTLTFRDLKGILNAILIKTENACKESIKESIFTCYTLMNEMLATSRKYNDIITLVLDRTYRLRSKKSSRLLIMPNNDYLFKKFVGECKGYCPILFVHPEVAKLHYVVEALEALEIPLLTEVITMCPVISMWYGYYVIPPGEAEIDFPVIRSAYFTNLYRALLAEFKAISQKTLKEEEIIHLGNLIRSTTVFVSRLDCSHIPVAYTIYGISRMVEEDYFIKRTSDGEFFVIVPSDTGLKPVEDQVNLHALKELFPAMGDIDDYMKICIRGMLSGNVEHKLDSQYLIRKDEERTIKFKIRVEDSEVVSEIQKYRKASNDRPHSRFSLHSYPIHRKVPNHHLTFPNRSSDLSSLSSRQHKIRREECFALSSEFLEDFPDLPKGQHHLLDLNGGKANFFSAKQSSVHNQTHSLSSKHINESDSSAPNMDTSPKFSKQDREIITCPERQLSNNPAGDSAVQQPSRETSTASKNSLVKSNSRDKPVSGHSEQPSVKQGMTNESSYSRERDLRKIKDEIWSWAEIPKEQIESRLLGQISMLQFSPANKFNSSNGVSSFWQSLWQLENEGQSSKLIGSWAEKAAYNHFVHLCKTNQPLSATSQRLCFPPASFDLNNWISSSRRYFEDHSTTYSTCDDTKGYDLCYRQTNGTVVYVEVKGHALESSSFVLSANEWTVAEKYSNDEGAVYVILGINLNVSALTGPTMLYMLEDPFAMEKTGDILKKSHTYVITTNCRQSLQQTHAFCQRLETTKQPEQLMSPALSKTKPKDGANPSSNSTLVKSVSGTSSVSEVANLQNLSRKTVTGHSKHSGQPEASICVREVQTQKVHSRKPPRLIRNSTSKVNINNK